MRYIKRERCRKFIIVVSIYFLSTSGLIAQDIKQAYYTWKPDSVVVYSERNQQGSVLKKLAYGERVNILKVFDEDVASSIPKASNEIIGKLPKTKWVQIEIDSSGGYLLLDQLGVLPVMEKRQNNFEDISSYFRRNFKIKDSVLVTKKYSIPASNKIYSVNEDSISYENGAYALVSFFDGCSENSYSVPKWDLNDAYNILAVTSFHIINSTSNNVSTELELVKIESDKYIFEDLFGFREFYIEVNNNNPIKFGWYSCD